MKIISVREQPEALESIISYFQKTWASETSMMVYDDAIRSSLMSDNALPQWFVLMDEANIIGCAGLITNDFISRMDLFPWLCALYINESYRGRNLGSLLIEYGKKKAKELGFMNLYLCTDHVGYYEKFGFSKIGVGYHPWGESSSIYAVALTSKQDLKQHRYI